MSKLNIDQKSVKALFSEKKADFLFLTISGLMPGARRNVRHSGTICSYLHFLITIVTNLKAIVMNTF